MRSKIHKNNLLTFFTKPPVMLGFSIIYLFLGWLVTPKWYFYYLWGSTKKDVVSLQCLLLIISSFVVFYLFYRLGMHFRLIWFEDVNPTNLVKFLLPFSVLGFLALGQSLINTIASIGFQNIIFLASTNALKRTFREYSVEGFTSLVNFLTASIMVESVLVFCNLRRKRFLLLPLVIYLIYFSLISERINILMIFVGIVTIYINIKKPRLKHFFWLLFIIIIFSTMLFSVLQASRWNFYSKSSNFIDILRFGFEQLGLYGTINLRNLNTIIIENKAFSGSFFSFKQPLVGIGLISSSQTINDLYAFGIIRGGAGTFSAFGEFFLDFGWFSLVIWGFWGMISGIIEASAKNSVIFQPLNALNLALLAITFQIGPVRTRTIVPLIVLTIIYLFTLLEDRKSFRGFN